MYTNYYDDLFRGRSGRVRGDHPEQPDASVHRSAHLIISNNDNKDNINSNNSNAVIVVKLI